MSGEVVATRAFFTFGAGFAVALLVDAFLGMAVPFVFLVAVTTGSLLFAASYRFPSRNVTAGD